jgi:adenylate kinase family enzyme
MVWCAALRIVVSYLSIFRGTWRVTHRNNRQCWRRQNQRSPEHLQKQRRLRHVEIDQLLWQEGWKLSPADVYLKQHAELIASDGWVIDGLGQQASIADRLARATEIILIDMPLWIHFWLAAERQIAWVSGKLEHTPGGISTIPPTDALFRTIWEVEQTWMPEVRALCSDAEANRTTVTRITSLEELNAFTSSV